MKSVLAGIATKIVAGLRVNLIWFRLNVGTRIGGIE